MIGVNQKTALVAVVAIAAVLAVSTIAIGHGRTAFAAEIQSMSTTLELTHKQIQTQTCQTVGGTSGIPGSCIGTSTDNVQQTGGMLKK